LVSVWADVTFMTAFASILIGLYFIFMTTEKSIIWILMLWLHFCVINHRL
jgi:hypothetical protein